MEMHERLPTMPDSELKTLLANAKRLEVSGTPKQQAAAAELAPLVEAEMLGRKPAAAEKMRAKRAATAALKPKAPSKAKAKKAAKEAPEEAPEDVEEI
jgi:hypothetical protein